MTDVTFRCDLRFEVIGGYWSDEFRIVLPTGEVLHARIISAKPERPKETKA